MRRLLHPGWQGRRLHPTAGDGTQGGASSSTPQGCAYLDVACPAKPAGYALRSDEDVIVDGEPVNPRLHVAMHQVVANQLLAGDPPGTWQAVQRLAGLGYDWHNIMHMIASLVTEDVYRALNEHRQPDPASYARRLNKLPGDWPPPEPAR